MLSLLLALGFILLFFAALHDWKTREVPDWLNYAGIAAGLGIRLIWSITTLDIRPFWSGVLGFTIFFGIGVILYYLGQWGGGDAKALMALGALLGFEVRSGGLMASFLANLLLVGGLYGLCWVLFLAVRHKKAFGLQLHKLWVQREYKLARTISYGVAAVLLLGILILPDAVLKLAFLLLLGAVILTGNLVAVVKAVELCCMYKNIPPHRLTEGDWVAKEVRVGKKILAGPRDLGATKQQIAVLCAFEKRGKIKKVLIKEGIPFLPSFFLAYCTMLLWGNLFLLALS